MRLLAVLAMFVAQLAAQPKPGGGFARWWPQFQAAVARRDAKTVAQGARYPMQWENGPTRDIQTEAELTGRFDFYFTAEIKRIIATKKPVLEPAGTYTITWKARGNEYSLYFKPEGTAFVLDGLSEGPP